MKNLVFRTSIAQLLAYADYAGSTAMIAISCDKLMRDLASRGS